LGVLDWTAADVVFIHSACFEGSLIDRLSVVAEGLPHGAVVLCVSKPLRSAQFEELFAWGCKMSYGEAVPVFVQRRL
jgi:hypothetical protein